MKNIAKCKLCQSIIESFHAEDYVECKCGEIAVDGGIAFRCAAKHWENFLRIDDNGHEIIVNVKETNVNPLYIGKENERKQVLDELEMMIQSIKKLPENAMVNPITHYDFYSSLLLLARFCKAFN